VILATDAAGASLWQGGLSPFGTPYTLGDPSGGDGDPPPPGDGDGLLASVTAASTSPATAGVFLRFPRQWDDPTFTSAGLDKGVYHNVHRWYEAGTGKYTKPDPLGDLPVSEPLQSPAIDPELFSPLYTYVGNNPTTYIDALGLLRFKGCTTQQQNAIGPAFKDYCQRIESPGFINCMCETPGTPPKLKRLCSNPKVAVRCKQSSRGFCQGNCGWAIPFGRTIRLCPSAFTPGLCGPLGCTLMHELTHISGRPGEKRPEKVEKCLGCP
jgi:RHS repeat-associated protein